MLFSDFDSTQQKQVVESRIEEIVRLLNIALNGSGSKKYKNQLARLGRGNQLPHWYDNLQRKGSLPNLDGKTIGSVIEMLFVSILEQEILSLPKGVFLRINPARGVDIPLLGLGVKSRSTNFCTSEPFFSAYERLYGGEYDCVVLLTNYQEAKSRPPLKLQILKGVYMKSFQLADRNLTALCKEVRPYYLDRESDAIHMFQFLAYVNQSDWFGKQILNLFKSSTSAIKFQETIDQIITNFKAESAKLERLNREPLDPVILELLLEARATGDPRIATLYLSRTWLTDNLGNAALLPSPDQFQKLCASPLEGKKSMSFALQWRYNFQVALKD